MGNTHCYGAEKGVREQAKESIASIKDAQKIYTLYLINVPILSFEKLGTGKFLYEPRSGE